MEQFKDELDKVYRPKILNVINWIETILKNNLLKIASEMLRLLMNKLISPFMVVAVMIYTLIGIGSALLVMFQGWPHTELRMVLAVYWGRFALTAICPVLVYLWYDAARSNLRRKQK